jgi:integrase
VNREIDEKAIQPQTISRHTAKAAALTLLPNGNVNRYILKPLCKKLEIPIGTTHAFRHGRVSLLQQNSVPGDLIKKWIGHISLRTTSKYSHFPPAIRKKVAASGIEIKDEGR